MPVVPPNANQPEAAPQQNAQGSPSVQDAGSPGFYPASPELRPEQASQDAPHGSDLEAMRSDTEYLSSFHYRRGAVPRDSACYRCHGGYGLQGDTKAKLGGMMHMLHTVTKNYEFPLKKVGTFDIQSCLDCHAQAAPFREQEAHRDPDLQQSLISGEIGCTGVCHAELHPPEALEGAAAWAASR